MRFIVAGYSPRLKEVPLSFLDSGKVIGVNQTYRIINDYLDAWLLWDHNISTTHKEIHDHKHIRCPKFVRSDPNNKEFFGNERGIFWFQSARKRLPLTWELPLHLSFSGSSITAAANLALVLGASEIILVGVDFIGKQRACGWQYPYSDLESMARLTSIYFKNFPIPVYKTVEESLLSLPFCDLGVKWTL